MITLREKSYGLFADVLGSISACFALNKRTGDLILQAVHEGVVAPAPALIHASQIDYVEVHPKRGIGVVTTFGQTYRIDGTISALNITEWEFWVNHIVKRHKGSL